MTNYKVGDPVVDLAQGRAMVVLEAPDLTVAEWSEQNGYELTENYANEKLGAADEEGVVRCVYVSDIRSEPSKDYTFPESRVALIDAHHADGGRRIADRVTADVLADVFRTLRENGIEGIADELAALLVAGDTPEPVVNEALELADVALTISGNSESVDPSAGGSFET